MNSNQLRNSRFSTPTTCK